MVPSRFGMQGAPHACSTIYFISLFWCWVQGRDSMSEVRLEQLVKLFEMVKTGSVTRENLAGFLFNPSQFLAEEGVDGSENSSPSVVHAASLIPKRWSVVPGQDVEPTIGAGTTNLELVSFIEGCGLPQIDGEEMRRLATVLKGNLGLADAKYLLDHQHMIPEEMRSKYLVFPGTLLCDAAAELQIFCLFWHDNQWGQAFRAFDDIWDNRYSFVGCKQKKQPLGHGSQQG